MFERWIAIFVRVVMVIAMLIFTNMLRFSVEMKEHGTAFLAGVALAGSVCLFVYSFSKDWD